MHRRLWHELHAGWRWLLLLLMLLLLLLLRRCWLKKRLHFCSYIFYYVYIVIVC